MVVRAIKNGKWLWLLGRVVKYVSLHIKIDYENKTWKLTSSPMYDPSWKKVDYSDIEKIFKAKPSSYHVHEERKADGTFQSFTVETY